MEILNWTPSDKWCKRIRRLSSWNPMKKKANARKTRLSGVQSLAATLRSLTREVTCDDAMRRRSIATVTQRPTTSSPRSTATFSATPIEEEELKKDFGREEPSSLDEPHMQVSLQCTLIQNERSLWSSSVCYSKQGLVSLEDIHDATASVVPPQDARHVVEMEGFESRTSDEAAMLDDEGSDTSTLVDCAASVCDSLREREKIHRYLSNPRYIVDESLDPERVPHIVITRPDSNEYWDDLYVAYNNSVDYLRANKHYLMVPLSSWNTQQQPTPFQGPLHQPPLEQAPTLCLLSELHKLTSLSQLSRHGMSIPEAIYKQLFEYAVSEAVASAATLRERYDKSVEMFNSFEGPYVWKDPAQPILAAPGPGAVTIISTFPTIAPHIIIHPALPPLPTVLEQNRTPILQDAAFGQLLTVRSCMVEIVNEPESWSDEHSEPDVAVDDLFEDSFSCPDSPVPQTPLNEELVGFEYDAESHTSSALTELEDLIEWDGGAVDEDPIQVDTSISDKTAFNTPEGTSSYILNPEFRIEEDEEELPSLDDW